MNKLGQVNVGGLIAIAVTIIVGAVLLVAVAGQVGTTSNTITDTNASFTAPAVSEVIDLTGMELIGTPVVINATGGETISSGNYTIDEGVSATTSVKTIRYTSTATSEYAEQPIFITYTYGADGYIADASARSIVSLILIFMALGIAMVALVPTLRSGLMDMIGK